MFWSLRFCARNPPGGETVTDNYCIRVLLYNILAPGDVNVVSHRFYRARSVQRFWIAIVVYLCVCVCVWGVRGGNKLAFYLFPVTLNWRSRCAVPSAVVIVNIRCRLHKSLLFVSLSYCDCGLDTEFSILFIDRCAGGYAFLLRAFFVHRRRLPLLRRGSPY